ncbi:MAG: sugar-binding transcriptional regulator [Limosilactobacillus gorillae]|uniref:sugar-binding transcriptional regulator n=1 Tax=Limosilactobacillus gorillae TaxID=1450649 RepID=UPI000ACFCBE9|nr:sugar-binding transcriptional regulator [Limosilactobacillus gorillae]MDO4856274.1 sugar-binding transcriptional regulator [Limosilactobacillus gorillae]
MRNEKLTDNQLRMVVKIARFYYLDKLSQTEIAKQMGISRPTVSRYLQHASEYGIVNIQINDPFDSVTVLSQQLAEKYHLGRVVIASQVGETNSQILDKLGEAAAKLLQEIVEDGDTIGLSWGRTMAAVANHLLPSDKKGVCTVYLKGTVANSSRNNYASLIANGFNQAFETQTEILPVPVIFDNQATRDVVLKDRFIGKVMQKAIDCEIAVFTVGTTRDDAMLFKLGYLNPMMIRHLQKEAVGDIISQFVDQDGRIVDPELTRRTVALPLEKLKTKKHSVLVAGGITKLPVLHAALVGGYAKELVTDLENAKQLVKM